MSMKYKILLQILIAIGIAVTLQFVIPLSWQPFYTIVGPVFGTNTGVGWIIFWLDTWFFSFAIAWLIYRENPYLNNFMMYSLIPLVIILAVEFIFYQLFWDYIHILPFIVDILILRKRDTLRKNLIVIFALIMTGLIFLEYYLGIAFSALPELLLLIVLPIYFGAVAGSSFFMVKSKSKKRGIIKSFLKIILIGFWGLGLFLGSIFFIWYLRPSNYVVNEEIVLDTWVAVDEGKHNSNSHMIYWNKSGAMYLAHDRRPFHLGTTDAKILIWNSTNAKDWTKVAEFEVEGYDVRDPKFGIIKNRLYLYFLINNQFPMALPHTTYFTYTENGVDWVVPEPIEPFGWNFWAPKTNDDITWYLPAYGRDPYSVRLLSSPDGENWTTVATMYSGEHCSESAIEFLPDGRMMLVARMEGTGSVASFMFGSTNASTLIATSPYPYTNWSSYIKSTVDKLDGLELFTYQNKVYAAARHQPGPRGVFTQLGSIFSRKRTGLYLVNDTTGLTYITDFPSAGDTAYCGVILNGTDAYISYYTSNFRYDYPWVLGWLAESDIRIAQINLTALAMWE